jgi:hypothetical protein
MDLSLSARASIVSPRYDAAFFTGSLLLPALLWAGFQVGWLSGIAVFAIFQLLFNLPHNFQTWTLTVLDPADRARNGRRYLIAAAALCTLFVLPAFFAPAIFPYSRDALLYWGYYHLVRQHYGFQRLYERKAGGVSARESFWYGRYLDVVSYAPLFLRFRDRELMTIHTPAGDVWIQHPVLPPLAIQLILAVYAAAIAAAFIHHLIARRMELLPRAYLLLSVTAAFGAAALIREVLVAVALLTSFHNLQYIGLVWFHNQNRARRSEARGNPAIEWLQAGHWKRYAAVSFAYGVVVFAPLAIWPNAPLAQIPITMLVALHYYVDGRAWRFREIPERGKWLGIA